MNNLLNLLGTAIGKVKPFLADGPAAIKALITNQPFPARTLVITMAVITALIWVITKAVFSPKPRR